MTAYMNKSFNMMNSSAKRSAESFRALLNLLLTSDTGILVSVIIIRIIIALGIITGPVIPVS